MLSLGDGNPTGGVTNIECVPRDGVLSAQLYINDVLIPEFRTGMLKGNTLTLELVDVKLSRRYRSLVDPSDTTLA